MARLFGWLVSASVGVHVAVLVLLPVAERVAPTPALPAIELAASPREPMPEEPKRDPEPAPVATAPAKAQAPSAAHAHVATAETTSTSAPLDIEAPVDFTGASGVAIAVPAAAPSTTETRPATSAPVRVAPPFVASSSLARAPRPPPRLDAVLERNYPADARRSGIAGRAVLRVRIEPDGRVGGASVESESSSGFGAACERTVRSARWEPPIDREGRAVTTEITYVCRFEVRS